ncbi:hypothetical protein BH10ACI4_BH10ACI4_04960 [soil metagenome]
MKRILAAVLTLSLAPLSHASLIPFQSFIGSYGVSTDGFGSLTNNGTITANVPVGATVTAAYLYSAYYGGSLTPNVSLNGSSANFTSNTLNPGNGLGAARADVTSLVASVVNGGGGGTYAFNVSEINGGNIDGEGLVVVYSLNGLPTSTIAILDGFSASTGDSTAVNFSQALDPTSIGFHADLMLGDSFSCCGQASTIKVNGTQITSNAGNNDDSKDPSLGNGNLITVGGWNDPYSILNPSYDNDHERYSLIPEILAGDTSIHINTLNPSGDDNIFLAVLNVSGEAAINAPPPNTSPVPEPGTILQLGTGLLSLGAFQARKLYSKLKRA